MKNPLIVALVLVSSAALAQVADKIPEIEALPMDKLESVHWDCDYMASVNMVDVSDAAICSAVYERLKAEKFGGDFNKMLAWWKENKTKQHTLRAKK